MSKNNKNSKVTHHESRGLMINTLYLNIAMTLIMAAVIFWLLAVVNANYLRKIEALSIFLPNREYYTDCMRLPGGLLTWASTFLTQSFFYPWLGAATYSVLLLGIVLVAYKAFSLPKYAYSALMILPSAMLLALLNLGYVIFSLKTPGYAFLLPLGILCGVLFFWLYRCLKAWWLRIIAVIVVSVGGYPFAGFYALLTGTVCAVYEFASAFIKGKVWWHCVIVACVGVFCVWSMPHYWMTNVDTDVAMPWIYRCPLPRFYDGEDNLWTPYIIVVSVLLMLAVIAAFVPAKQAKTVKCGLLPTVSTAAVGIISVICVFVYRYDDSNFSLTLDLDRALWQQQWQQAADMMASMEDEPTRLNVILTDMALLRSGEAAERMFTYPNGSADYKTARALRATHDAGAMLFSYHTGQVSYAYRWAMEYKVEHGMNVEQLKMMTKCALLNSDYGVARKCLETLKQTAFHRDWADKYSAYIDNPSQIDSDSELKAVKSLITDDNMFIEDRGQLEGYIWPKLADTRGGNADVLELSLLSDLLCRRVDEFAERLPYYARQHDKLPRHFQEGILIWSRAHENTGFRMFNIDQEVKDRFKSFLITQNQYKELPLERQAELMRPAFGDTYWFYALYMRNLKII